MVLRVLANSEQNKQVDDDTLARETMKTQEDTNEVEELALVHSKQEEILNHVKLLLQREKFALVRVKLLLEENAHLKEEIATERKTTCFLQSELQRSQQLLSEMGRMTVPKEGKVKIR